MGSSRKRAGTGPTESASRPRRGTDAIEREDERSVRGACEERGAPPRVRGDSLARPLAQPRGNSRRRNCAQQFRETHLHARPGGTGAEAACSRLTPSHVTTCAVAAAANALQTLPARSCPRITGEHQKDAARGPAHPSPRPAPPRPDSCSRWFFPAPLK